MKAQTKSTIKGALKFTASLATIGAKVLFGWLYRKYGIQYAMIGHAVTHITCMISVFLVL